MCVCVGVLITEVEMPTVLCVVTRKCMQYMNFRPQKTKTKQRQPAKLLPESYQMWISWKLQNIACGLQVAAESFQDHLKTSTDFLNCGVRNAWMNAV